MLLGLPSLLTNTEKMTALADFGFHSEGKAGRCAQVKCKYFVDYIDYFVYGKDFDGTIEADKLRQEETDLEADLIDWEGVD